MRSEIPAQSLGGVWWFNLVGHVQHAQQWNIWVGGILECWPRASVFIMTFNLVRYSIACTETIQKPSTPAPKYLYSQITQRMSCPNNFCLLQEEQNEFFSSKKESGCKQPKPHTLNRKQKCANLKTIIQFDTVSESIGNMFWEKPWIGSLGSGVLPRMTAYFERDTVVRGCLLTTQEAL